MPVEDKLGSGDVGEAGYPLPLGPYLLLHRLAKGGMGEVHLAKHGGLAGIEKYCVVKTLKRGALEDDESVRRFMDEARVVVNLAHRNICSVFDVGRADERYYLAMEHVAGRDLRAVVQRAREKQVAISTPMALHLVGEVLEALDYAHRFTHPTTGEPLHLVHRDVSPANVMVSVEGEVKLIDFGLALSRQKQQRTEPHMIMGKIAYMAPEQLAAEPLDRRTDLFAAGVMLYELLAGERFYGDLLDGGIVLAASTGSYVPPKLQALDEELGAVLRGALQRSVALRTPDCAELREQLNRYAVTRRISAGARELRELMEALFPEERERGRNLLARFADVRGPHGFAEVAASAPATKPAAAPPPPAAPAVDEGELPSDFDTFESFDFEISEPSTPVGRVKLAKAKPEEVKPGTPRPALLERLGLPGRADAEPTPGARADGVVPTGLDDGSPPAGDAARLASGGRRSARPGWRLGAATLLIAGAGLFLLVTRAPEPARRPVAAQPAAEWIVDAPDPRPSPPEPAPPPLSAAAAAPLAVSITTTSTLPADLASPKAGAEQAGAEQDRATRAGAARREGASVQRKVRKVQKYRSKPRVPKAPGPAAKPERKISYLHSSCRQKAPCAAELVRAFREMRVDDARVFWAKVDACLSRCMQ